LVKKKKTGFGRKGGRGRFAYLGGWKATGARRKGKSSAV